MEFITINETEGGFAAHVNVLPGCCVVRDTREEAIAALPEAARLWVEGDLSRSNPQD